MAFRGTNPTSDNNNADYNESFYGSQQGNNKWIPQLYASKIQTRFYEKVMFTEITNTDYEGQIKNQGDKVIIRFAPDVTINTHVAGDKLTYQQLDAANVELDIDQAFNWAFQMPDEDETQFDIAAANAASSNAARLLMIDVERDVFSYMAGAASPLNTGEFAGLRSGIGGAKTVLPGGADTPNTSGGIDFGSSGAPVILTKDNMLEYIVFINQLLDEQDVEDDGRWVVLPQWACSLLKNGELRRADVTGDNVGLIRSGLVGMVDKTMIYKSNNLLTAVDSAGSTTPANKPVTSILAGCTLATTFAAQINKSEQLRIQDYFGNYYRGLMVYGRRVVRPEALVVLYATNIAYV